MNAIVILCDTLRRDHIGAYNLGRALNECWSKQAPSWKVDTPNMDRLADRGVVFDNCWAGSTPCMPARRDIYTGRYEFLERGWGPLEEDDKDLPRLVSGPPNQSVQWSLSQGYRISNFITDHFHMWEQGSGNYHMGYTGFDFVRGCEADAYYTAPAEFDCPEVDRLCKNERHWRNVHYLRNSEDDYFCAQTFERAAKWLKRNKEHEDFFLHLDIFDPHEPWDPPEELLKQFDPKGYDVDGLGAAAPYSPWRDVYTEEQFHNMRARYAAKVVFLDKQLGRLLDAMDELGLWDNTMIIFTTDHGTFNGDHDRIGKMQTHEFDAKNHIPFIVSHPDESVHGQRREQLVQLVDIFPTVLESVGRPMPDMSDDKPIHGVSLLGAIGDSKAKTRDYAVAGMFGKSVTITNGKWVLHKSPVAENRPLNWHGYCLAKFLAYELGEFKDGCREVIDYESWEEKTWLSNLKDDPNELVNLAEQEPEMVKKMELELEKKLIELKAPEWQIERLGLCDC